MNDIKRIHTLAAAFAAVFMAAAPRICAENSAHAPAWQEAQDQVDLRRGGVAGGLDFMVRLDPETGWPTLEKEMLAGFGRHVDYCDGPHASRAWSPISFGSIRGSGGTGPELTNCMRSWSETTISIDYTAGKPDGNFVLTESAGGIMDLAIVVSRLHPGIMARCSGPMLLFAGGASAGSNKSPSALPGNWAASVNGEIMYAGIDKIPELPADALGRGWLLAWYGEDTFFRGGTRADMDEMAAGYPVNAGDKSWNPEMSAYWADCPMLLLFSSEPEPLFVPESGGMPAGLMVEFADDTGAVVILPVLGERLPPVAETGKWRAHGLPADIVKQCDWWASHIAKFPAAARESSRYDAAADRVILTESFTWADFRKSGRVAAPVPPALATAFLEGFPLEFSVKPDNPGLVTAAGSFVAVPGAETYEISIAGLGKYAAPRPAPAGKAPERLVNRLSEQVGKMVEAGHLAPSAKMSKLQCCWAGNFNVNPYLAHGNPGEALHALAEALPFLSDSQKSKTLKYMRAERELYPPESMPQLSGVEGARREAFPLSDEFLAKENPGPQQINWIDRYKNNNFYAANNLIPGVSFYHLAAYYNAAGDDGLSEAWPGISAAHNRWLEHSDWATGGIRSFENLIRVMPSGKDVKRLMMLNIFYGIGGVNDINNFFAAGIGLIRLARMAGDQAGEQAAWGVFARVAAARFAAGKMTGHLYKRGLLTLGHGQKTPEEDRRLPWIVNDAGMTLSIMESVHHGGGLMILRDAVPELAIFSRDWLGPETEFNIGDYTRYSPNWYLAWSTAAIHAESGLADPQDAFQAFMAHALIFQSPPEWLERHLDLPWHPRGDLYYMQKLVETIRAYAQTVK